MLALLYAFGMRNAFACVPEHAVASLLKHFFLENQLSIVQAVSR